MGLFDFTKAISRMNGGKNPLEQDPEFNPYIKKSGSGYIDTSPAVDKVSNALVGQTNNSYDASEAKKQRTKVGQPIWTADKDDNNFTGQTWGIGRAGESMLITATMPGLEVSGGGGRNEVTTTPSEWDPNPISTRSFKTHIDELPDGTIFRAMDGSCVVAREKFDEDGIRSIQTQVYTPPPGLTIKAGVLRMPNDKEVEGKFDKNGRFVPDIDETTKRFKPLPGYESVKFGNGRHEKAGTFTSLKKGTGYQIVPMADLDAVLVNKNGVAYQFDPGKGPLGIKEKELEEARYFITNGNRPADPATKVVTFDMQTNRPVIDPETGQPKMKFKFEHWFNPNTETKVNDQGKIVNMEFGDKFMAYNPLTRQIMRQHSKDQSVSYQPNVPNTDYVVGWSHGNFAIEESTMNMELRYTKRKDKEGKPTKVYENINSLGSKEIIEGKTNALYTPEEAYKIGTRIAIFYGTKIYNDPGHDVDAGSADLVTKALVETIERDSDKADTSLKETGRLVAKNATKWTIGGAIITGIVATGVVSAGLISLPVAAVIAGASTLMAGTLGGAVATSTAAAGRKDLLWESYDANFKTDIDKSVNRSLDDVKVSGWKKLIPYAKEIKYGLEALEDDILLKLRSYAARKFVTAVDHYADDFEKRVKENPELDKKFHKQPDYLSAIADVKQDATNWTSAAKVLTGLAVAGAAALAAVAIAPTLGIAAATAAAMSSVAVPIGIGAISLAGVAGTVGAYKKLEYFSIDQGDQRLFNVQLQRSRVAPAKFDTVKEEIYDVRDNYIRMTHKQPLPEPGSAAAEAIVKLQHESWSYKAAAAAAERAEREQAARLKKTGGFSDNVGKQGSWKNQPTAGTYSDGIRSGGGARQTQV